MVRVVQLEGRLSTAAAEELVQHLKDENNILHSEVSELRNEVTSISSKKDEECAKYQKLLMEENEKSKMLSNEVERLQKLLNESCGLKDGMTMQGKSASPGPNKQSLKVHNAAGQNNDRNDEVVSQEVSSSSMIMTRKRRQEARTKIKDGNPIHGSDGPSKKRIKESARDLPKVSSGLCCDQLPVCLEHLSIKQVRIYCNVCGWFFLAGYTFSLTWVKKSTRGELETELVYQVGTLGTFEKVVPEWMRSVIMFSISMCPIFFERLAQVKVIKMHH
ncbi:hypothetical protein LINPERPRIM_LOCUS24830 [Linum perenne]